MSDTLFLLVALVAGITMAVQGSLNSVLGEISGLWEANFVVHVIGTLLIVVIIFLLNLNEGDFTKLADAPWYVYLGGILNVIIIYTVVVTIPKLGVANATASIIVGQVTTAAIIDHFGFWGLDAIPFHWTKLAGVALLAAGAKLVLNSG